MLFALDTAEFFIPDGAPEEQALARTTHLAVSAHQDDLEIMAAGPIVECYRQPERWFTGVALTDGRGSPRNGLYQDYSDDAMRRVRFTEQKQAAQVGEYAALALLDYPSRAVKDAADLRPAADLASIFQAAHPRFVYTHNLADKHDTHVAVALRVITALRRLPRAMRPEKLYGCEVWRDLDWLDDAEKVAFDLSAHENLQAALLGVFDSQIAGGKRYDLASLGRRRANATYFASHGVDESTALSFAMDLTPLLTDTRLDPAAFIQTHIAHFAADVSSRLARLA
ncbi:MAG TPA: PIG-L family deacetylase [Anaerolineaceae bacterium]|jgi:LmbE family N-acetylglucosaminyl deacetylase